MSYIARMVASNATYALKRIFSGLEIVLTKMGYTWAGLFPRVSSNGANFSQKCNVCILAKIGILMMEALNSCQWSLSVEELSAEFHLSGNSNFAVGLAVLNCERKSVTSRL